MMRAFTIVSIATLSLAASACSPAAAKPAQPPGVSQPTGAQAKKFVPPAKRLAEAEEAFDKSEYADAEAGFRAAAVGKQRGPALTGLARVMLITGRYGEAIKTARNAAKSGKEVARQAHVVAAKALRRQGKLAEAKGELQKVTSDPEAREARLLMGELLIEEGKRSQAESPLMTLVQDFNDDRITDTDGPELGLVGRAAHLLRSPQDANDAFNQSERALKGHVPVLLWRAELFLEKYDPGHAEEVTKEVLAKAPNHPDALVWMAHVKLAQALDFDAAESLARKALKVNPKHSQAHLVLAGISLRDMELAEADKRIDAGLKHNPRNLDLLSMKVATRFLSDDVAGFEKAKKKVLKLNPQYTRMYQIVGDYAEWEHRYEEIVKLMKEAIAIDSEDSKAQAQLGLNLIRSGDDDGGVKALQTAFDNDPFNVRVFNTLNLYEKTIPQQYETHEHGQFRFRFHKKESKILKRYVPGLMDQAWRFMVKAYGYTPSKPVGVELYSSRQDFSIRTSGLPHTAIQGVCFGKTLASMSPREETFNVGMTLWHELAHVFHIQQSKSHVPRWFTEGMAEYETIVERDEWQREHDPDLFAALREDRIPKLGSMNKAFTRAEEMSDIATAYYASSQILVMLADKYGRGKLNQMLELWGAGKRTPVVIQTALGKSTQDLDKEFRDWAAERLKRYKTQFVPIQRTGPLDTAEKRAKDAPKDAQKQVIYALALLRHGKGKKAEGVLAEARKLDPKNADARYLTARLSLMKRDAGGAQKILQQMIADKQDGYAVRMALVTIAEAKRDLASVKRELKAAHDLDPSVSEPIAGLVDIAKKENDDKTQLWGLKKLAKLEQHDPRVYRRLMQLLMKKGDLKAALKAGEAGLWADLEGLKTHQVFAEVLIKSKMIPRAIFELETALECAGRPGDYAEVHALLAEAYKAVPNRKKAVSHAKQARKLDPKNKNERVKGLKKLGL